MNSTIAYTSRGEKKIVIIIYVYVHIHMLNSLCTYVHNWVNIEIE